MIKRVIKKILRSKPKKTNMGLAHESLSEDQYYKKLFTEDPLWSKPDPNEEEKERWIIVENFIFYVKGHLNKNKKNELEILDLGCGRGWLTNLMSAHGEIMGIEPVEEVIKYAQILFPHLKLVSGTSSDILDSRKGYFNLIVCSEVIEHIPDQGKDSFVKDINTLLTDDGFVIITTPREEAQKEWMLSSNPDQPIEEWISEEALEELFVSNGFQKHILERLSVSPMPNKPKIEIYQLWLFQKIKHN